MLAAAGVAGVAGLLAVAGAGQAVRTHLARSQVQSAQRQVAALQGQVTKLTAETAVHGKVVSRAQMVRTALRGDVDWVRVISEVQAVTPPGLSLETLSGTRAVAGSPGPAGTGIGSLTFGVTGSGGLPAVAAWIDGLQSDHSLEGTWVSGISVATNGGTVTFSSSSNLTPKADSNRSQAVNP